MTPPLLARRYEFGEFQFEVDSLRLLRGGEIIPLPPKAATLLRLFLESRGAVLKKDDIFAALWPHETVEESNLTRTIYLLRKTLTQHAPTEQFLETLPKIGYRFTAQAREILSPATVIEDAASRSLTAPRTVGVLQEEKWLSSSPPATMGEKMGWRESALSLVYRRVQVDANQGILPARSGLKLNRQVKMTMWAVSALVVLGLGAMTAQRFFLPGAKVNSVAVLPFSELGVESRESVLGLGMADTVISRLGSLGEIEVRPTSAIRRYAERAIDPMQAGRELNVEAVLTGNIQRLSGQVRITAQLLRVSDGKTLWSVALDDDTSGLFALQDHLTEQFTAALRLPLTEQQRRQLRKRETENLAAYNLYLKGRLFWNRRSPEWIRKAIESFEAAIQTDANYALAYSGLADCYSLTASGMPSLERMPKAKAAALKALELDNELAEAYASLGFIKYKFDLDWHGAEELLKRAIALNPNYATAHHWYGECLSLEGRADESLVELQRAEKLDPLSLPIKQDIGESFYRARRYEHAIKRLREVQELDPSFARVHRSLYMTYQAMGRYDDAINERLTQVSQWKMAPESLSALKQAYQESGWQGYWRKEVELMESHKMGGGDEGVLAQRYIYLDDKEHAFEQMEKSFAQRSGIPLQIKAAPEFDSLRSDPRFQKMLERAGHVQ
ncbi:MAG: tetratricopeptide repeat protein [Acidobacteriota bacterium]